MTLQNQIEIALKDACRSFVFSGYQLVTETPKGVFSWEGGTTSYWPNGQAVTDETYFDLGSLTKVILTTSVLARLVERKEIKLKTPLKDYLSIFNGTRYQDLTLEQLLTHQSGLIAWYPFYTEQSLSLLDLFLKKENEFLPLISPSPKPTYSDLGFLLLGEVLKEKFGTLIDLFENEIVQPLQLKDLSFGPLLSKNCAATEFCEVRKKLIQGEVFDLNTAHLGNVCSHAGLFSSAKNLLPWAREWLRAVKGQSEWLSVATAKEFTTIRAIEGSCGPSSMGTWARGWDTKSKAFSSAGRFFSGASFGHLGYPGTSVWIDPEKSGIAILLTNRVHPSRLDERIKRFRPPIHDLVAKFWESHGD